MFVPGFGSDWGERPEKPYRLHGRAFGVMIDPELLWNLQFMIGYIVLYGTVTFPITMIRMGAAWIPK